MPLLKLEFNREFKPTNSFDSGAGVVWTMKHSPTQDLIAIGGEDGIVRLYDVIDTTDDNCLQYNKSFERQDSRILSICWHPRGKVTTFIWANAY